MREFHAKTGKLLTFSLFLKDLAICYVLIVGGSRVLLPGRESTNHGLGGKQCKYGSQPVIWGLQRPSFP
jgi:hypothetical protein